MGKQEYRDLLADLDVAVSQLPGATKGDIPGTLEHTFAGGMYIRQMTLPAGMVFTTKIHKKEHPFFILSGEVTVITEEGRVKLIGPYHGITKIGTKRAIYVHTETVWVTIHVTDSTDPKEIEEEVIAKSFEEIDELELLAEPGGQV